MRRLAIDTNIYVAFKRGQEEIVSIFRHCDTIGVDITVIAELLCGFKCGSRERQNRNELESFLDSPRVTILNHDFHTAEYYSNLFKQLRDSGTPIPSNDIWIAASAMRHSLTLLSMDRHFEKIPGLLLLKM